MLVKELNIKQKDKGGRMLSMLSGTLDANLLRNILSGKRVKVVAWGWAIRAGDGVICVDDERIRAGQDF